MQIKKNNNNSFERDNKDAWDDIPVGKTNKKKNNETLKGWEDAYPAE